MMGADGDVFSVKGRTHGKPAYRSGPAAIAAEPTLSTPYADFGSRASGSRRRRRLLGL